MYGQSGEMMGDRRVAKEKNAQALTKHRLVISTLLCTEAVKKQRPTKKMRSES